MIIEFYLFCHWKDLSPTYRIYVNDELFTERTYIWRNDTHILQERLAITTDLTAANIRIEQVGIKTGVFRVERIITDPPGLDVKIKVA